eukprot:Sdes_comp20882_c0_seq2m17895
MFFQQAFKNNCVQRCIIKAGFSTSSKTSTLKSSNRAVLGLTVAAGVAASCAAGYFVVDADSPQLHAQEYPWNHKGHFDTFDHASIRRGYQVYKEVCSACHGIDRISFRNLVGVSHTEDQAKAIAEEYQIRDGPNEQGQYFERPGKLSDRFPNPFPNEEAARFANNGAYPPDLSLMTKSRHGGESYVFALLTGYREPPAGVVIREGLNYNPYFPGGAIGMARVLYDGMLEYEDGTPATTSQLAKDVCTFLAWTAEPEHDDRKRMGVKAILILSACLMSAWYMKRFKWSPIKTRKIVYRPVE